MKQKILHYPRLDTIIMVEEAIKKAREYPNKRQLWKSLPRKIMYQTFLLILDYLEESGKITMKDGEIIWIWDPGGVKKYIKSELIIK